MSDTETKKDGETETKPPHGLEQVNWDEVRRAILSVKGVNPDAEQTITDFMDMKDPVQGTNLPTRRDVQVEVYLEMCGKFLFPDNPDDPFTFLRNSIATTFKAKGGEKAKQFVEMVRNQPDLSALASASPETKQGIFSRVFGRGKE